MQTVHVGADLVQAGEVELAQGQPCLVRALRNDIAPRVDHHRVAKAELRVEIVLAALRSRHHIALVLNSSRTKQGFPVR